MRTYTPGEARCPKSEEVKRMNYKRFMYYEYEVTPHMSSFVVLLKYSRSTKPTPNELTKCPVL